MTIAAVQSTPYLNQMPTTQSSPYAPASTYSDSNPAYSTDENRVSTLLRDAAFGGIIAHYKGAEMNANMRSIFSDGIKNVPAGLKSTAMTGLKATGVAALGIGLGSSIINGYRAATGKIETGEAMTNIAKDTIRGTLAGAGGVTVGGLAGFIPVGGAMGTVIMVGAGAVGGVLGARLSEHITNKF
jgi:hypothetical protein